MTLKKILITGMLGAMCLAFPFFTQAQVNSAFDSIKLLKVGACKAEAFHAGFNFGAAHK
jgi:hypothetical protein